MILMNDVIIIKSWRWWWIMMLMMIMMTVMRNWWHFDDDKLFWNSLKIGRSYENMWVGEKGVLNNIAISGMVTGNSETINNRIKHFIQKNPLLWATDIAGETFTHQLGWNSETLSGMVVWEKILKIQSLK